ERREVVMKHEALPGFPFEALDLLSILSGAERTRHEGLRFTARKDRRPVRARQHADLDPNRPDLVERAPVEPDAVLEHLFSQHLFLELFEDLLGFDPALDLPLG